MPLRMAVSWTLALDSLFVLATAFVYAYVGTIVRSRPVTETGARTAIRWFAAWWYGLAALSALGGVRSGLAALGVLDLGVHVALSYGTVIPLVGALAGLLGYLLYIYTGSSRVFLPVAAVHVLLGAWFFYLAGWLGPERVTTTDWSVTIENSRELSGPLLDFLLLAILGPVLFAAVMYATLAFRAPDRTTRYRILVVSGAFVLWFGSAAVASVTGLARWYWWPLASRFIALVATGMVLMAFRPPGTIRRALAVEGVYPSPRDAREDLRDRVASRAEPLLA